METFGTLVFLVLLIFTIVHMWKRVNANFFLKLIIAIAIVPKCLDFFVHRSNCCSDRLVYNIISA